MNWDSKIVINNNIISNNRPTYFICDIAANHDGDLMRAKDLIWLAKESGADCAKFQHFKAEKIVSDYGFRSLPNGQQSHQSKWEKSVFEIYKQYECNLEWTEDLVQTAEQANIDFMTSPYDFDSIDKLDSYLPAYKIGSGDITWIEMLQYISRKNKPVLLASGASTMIDVERAVSAITEINQKIVLMQCNTNYTFSHDNIAFVNLNVLKTFSKNYPGMVLGLSDHTSGHTSVLGAITLGARVIEKHFTDDNTRIGPDHLFAMNPKSWREMVDRSRELESALGDGIKKVEDNEGETVIIQRRCLRLNRELKMGDLIQKEYLDILRPAPENALKPYEIDFVIGKKLLRDKEFGCALYYEDLV